MKEQQVLAIEWACNRLIAHYANLVDEARWADLGALYHPDSIMTRPSAPADEIVGTDAILAAFQSRPGATVVTSVRTS